MDSLARFWNLTGSFDKLVPPVLPDSGKLPMQNRFSAAIGAVATFVLCHSVLFGQSNLPQQGTSQAGSNQQNFQTHEGSLQDSRGNERRVIHDPGLAQAAMDQLMAGNFEPLMPRGFPLDAANQQWVDQLLQVWEQSSDQVRSYRCDFKRWHYMPNVLAWRDPNTNKLAARMITVGTIRYANPDRGRYDIDEVWHFNAPEQADGDPKYDRNPDKNALPLERETWICDGKAIYEFDYINKRLNEHRLPPEMQGEGLKNSPLPFVFGAKADDLSSRFWIRPMVPEGLPEGYYMIEAFPKTATDARAYSKIQIVLSSEPFLPVRVELFSVSYDIRNNPESMVLVFENRKINDPRDMIQKVISEIFSRPLTPVGWERFEGELGQEPSLGLYSPLNLFENGRSGSENQNLK